MTIRYAVPDDVPALSAVEAECFPPAEAATAAEFAKRVAHYADAPDIIGLKQNPTKRASL